MESTSLDSPPGSATCQLGTLGRLFSLWALVSSYDEVLPWESDAVVDVKVLDWGPHELESPIFSQKAAQGLGRAPITKRPPSFIAWCPVRCMLTVGMSSSSPCLFPLPWPPFTHL